MPAASARDADDLDDGFMIVIAIVVALLAVVAAAAAFGWVVLPLLAVVVDAAIVVVLFATGLVPAWCSGGRGPSRPPRRAATDSPARSLGGVTHCVSETTWSLLEQRASSLLTPRDGWVVRRRGGRRLCGP